MERAETWATRNIREENTRVQKRERAKWWRVSDPTPGRGGRERVSLRCGLVCGSGREKEDEPLRRRPIKDMIEMVSTCVNFRSWMNSGVALSS